MTARHWLLGLGSILGIFGGWQGLSAAVGERPAPSDWGQPANALMQAVPPRELDDSVGLRGSGKADTRLWIRQTDFRLHDDIGFFIRQMLINMRPNQSGTPLLLDDPTSMVAQVAAGDIFVADKTLDTLLNEDLRASNAPVRNLRLQTRAGGQEVHGELLRKGRWRPLKMVTDIEVIGPMQVALVPRQIQVDGVDVTPSLAAASIEMAEVLSLKTRNMELVGNRILVDLDGLFPPPRLEFQVRALELAEGGLDLALGDVASLDWPRVEAPDSYMFIEGGDIKMTRTILVKAYALFTSLSRQQPLLFNLYDYRRQLQYGEIRLREDGMVHIAVSPVKAPAPEEKQP